MEVGANYIELFKKNRVAVTSFRHVPRDLFNRVPKALFPERVEARLLAADGELLDEYQKKGCAYVEVYNGLGRRLMG